MVVNEITRSEESFGRDERFVFEEGSNGGWGGCNTRGGEDLRGEEWMRGRIAGCGFSCGTRHTFDSPPHDGGDGRRNELRGEATIVRGLGCLPIGSSKRETTGAVWTGGSGDTGSKAQALPI